VRLMASSLGANLVKKRMPQDFSLRGRREGRWVGQVVASRTWEFRGWRASGRLGVGRGVWRRVTGVARGGRGEREKKTV
jgi:hypothetical protein